MYDWLKDELIKKTGAASYFKEEWGWQRYSVGGKLFADIGHADGKACMVTFRCEPQYGDLLIRRYRAAAPGYYTNKERNVTIWFDVNAVPERDRNQTRGLPEESEEYPTDGEVREIAQAAYNLAFNSLTKKAQKEIAGDGKGS